MAQGVGEQRRSCPSAHLVVQRQFPRLRPRLLRLRRLIEGGGAMLEEGTTDSLRPDQRVPPEEP